MPYQQALEELPSFNIAQLTELRKRCALLLQGKASVGNTVEEADWILEGILNHCQQTGMYTGRTFHLKKSGSFASFATKSDSVRELLLECCGAELSPVQRVALGQVAARELGNLLMRIYHSPPNFQLLMTRVHWIPEAIEEAFPGYMSSKLLQLAVPYDGE